MVTNLEQLLPIMLLYPLVTCYCEITWQIKNISTNTVPMTSKLDSMVTNLERILPIMLIRPLVTWFYEIKWQTKDFISLLLQCLWPPNLAGWWLTCYPRCYSTFWSCDFAKSRDKLKAYISTTMMSITTNFARDVTDHKGVPPIKLHDP